MANAFTKAQFMEPPGSELGPTPIGAVKAGDGIAIDANGTISATRGGGTINNIVCTNGIQGGGGTPQVFIGLLPPTSTTIGGVYTIDGSGISIDSNGLIRSAVAFGLEAGPGIVLSNVTPDGATISTAVAGNSSITRGAIYVDPLTNPGVQVSAAGALSLTPPIAGGIGGVRQGPGTSIDPVTGVITATGSGGTITAVGAGTGLGGGGTSGAVSLFLRPPSGTTIGGVYGGQNVTIEADGKLNVASAALGVLSVNATSGSAIVVDNTDASNPTIGVNVATTTQPGVTTLSNSVTSTSETTAATSKAVNDAFVVADAALPRSGGQLTGLLSFQGGQTFPGTVEAAAFTQTGGILVGDTSPPGYAQLPVGVDGQVLTANSSSPLGVEWSANGTGTVTSVTGTAPVQVSNSFTTPQITIDSASTSNTGIVQLYDGTDSTSQQLAATANAVKTTFDVANGALQLTGGTMTGNIDFNPGQNFPGVLPLGGGTLTGAVTFAAGQTFPGVIAEGALAGAGAINISGTLSNPIIEANTATTSALGVVQPDGTTITITAGGVISAVAAASGTLQTVTDAGATTSNPISVASSSYSSTIGTQTIEILQLGTGGEPFTLSNTGGAASLVYGNRTFATAGLYFDQLNGTTLNTWTSLPVNINSGYNVVVTTNDGGGPTYTMGIDHFTIDNGGAIIDGPVQIINGSSLSVEGIFTNQGLVYPLGDGTAGQVIVTDGNGNLSFSTMLGANALLTTGGTMTGNITFNAGQTFPGTLPLSGGTMTGTISFAAGQTISGYIANSLMTTTGDMVYAASASSPARLPIGASGTILGVNGGLPAWRTSTQLGLLTSAAASTTYAPLNTPTFTGPVTVNAGAGGGANGLVLSGGNLVLSTSWEPASSTDVGSTGEIAWGGGYLYFCYAPNQWGRIAIDLTPF